jgi:hypothetical protein
MSHKSKCQFTFEAHVIPVQTIFQLPQNGYEPATFLGFLKPFCKTFLSILQSNEQIFLKFVR